MESHAACLAVHQGTPISGASLAMGKRLLYVVSILLGVVGFCAIPLIVGMQNVLWTVSQVGWLGILLCVANASGTLLIPAIGWWLLMRAEGIPATLHTRYTGESQFRSALCAVCAHQSGERPHRCARRARLVRSRHGGLCQCRRPWGRQRSGFCPGQPGGGPCAPDHWYLAYHTLRIVTRGS